MDAPSSPPQTAGSTQKLIPRAPLPPESPQPRRSRSPSISAKVNDGIRSLKSLSPPALIRSTLSPLSASLETITKLSPKPLALKKRKSQSSLPDLAAGAIHQHTDIDMARPTNMAKSFVSLLTTASLYNGKLQDMMELEPNEEVDETAESSTQDVTLSRNPTLFEALTEDKPEPTGITLNDAVQTEQNLSSKAKALALSEQVKKAFQITEDDEFVADYRCWLMKDVLLQGHMYITKKHLMFLAFLPKGDTDKVALSGTLAMESLIPSPIMSRYWAVLRKSSLSLYNNSSDLYFPVLTIDLRKATRAEVVTEATAGGSKGSWIKIFSETKTYKFFADSDHSARSWVGLLRKHIFTSRNNGDCVTVKIPLQNIIDLEETPIFEAAETLRLKVLESPTLYAIDDYFFMFFNSGPEVAQVLSTAIELSENVYSTSTNYDLVVDSTADLSKPRTRSLKKVFNSSHSRSASTTSSTSSKDQYVGISSDIQEVVVEQYISRDLNETVQSPPQSPTYTGTSFIPGYAATTKSLAQAKSTLDKWTPKVFKSASTMWASHPVHYAEKNSLERGSEDEYLATDQERLEITQRFQNHFSLSKSNILVSTYYAHLQRNVPTYGKIYLGSSEICFRSLVPGFNTKMILPYKDIENCYKEKGFKFGYYGLVIVIHGHEELFFEFSSTVARDDCEFLLLKQLDKSASTGNTSPHNLDSAFITGQSSSSSQLEAAKLKLFEDKIHSSSGLDVPIIIEDHPYLDTSIRPKKSYKISLLTIGSRGDVQPYIALGKGLKKEGHQVTIITHKEFEGWILNHGLEFKEIAGNPTELMSLMVSHGSMNVGLLKEASSKFRGWITDLLNTSWEACQGAEILIESPSAMGGIHIAEALGIPYFRAFTMPWTRTRAYPHAFIVPEQKQGGSYNYLTHVLFENIFWKGISGQVNKWRKEVLNLPKTNLDLLQQNKVPFLYNVSPTVMAPPVDYSDWIKVTGYWFLDEGITYDPPEELVSFIKKAKEDDKKLVYIGFGSIVVSNPKELTEAVVAAVLQADVRCILNKGWSERLGGANNRIEIELPYEVYNAGSLPHDWLFPQIDAAVHHGGSGTTGATLRAGLPTIIKPFFADQFFYANRVEDIGAGIALKKLNVKSLSKALKEITTNQRIITKAKSIGEKINKESGVSNAISVIYHELEYARELIKNKTKIQITQEDEKAIEDNDNDQILANLSGVDDQARDEDYDDEWGSNNEGSWLLV